MIGVMWPLIKMKWLQKNYLFYISDSNIQQMLADYAFLIVYDAIAFLKIKCMCPKYIKSYGQMPKVPDGCFSCVSPSYDSNRK